MSSVILIQFFIIFIIHQINIIIVVHHRRLFLTWQLKLLQSWTKLIQTPHHYRLYVDRAFDHQQYVYILGLTIQISCHIFDVEI